MAGVGLAAVGAPMNGSPWRRRLPRVRILNDICDWQDWQRPRHSLVRRVEYRRADNGMPVVVLVPTVLGRVVMAWRQWRDV